MLECRTHVIRADNTPGLSRGSKGEWEIHLRYPSPYSFYVIIKHGFLGQTNDVTVKAYLDGDEYVVLKSHIYLRARIDEAVAHSSPDADEESIEVEVRSKHVVIDNSTLWETVDDAIARWNAMLFLFSPNTSW